MRLNEIAGMTARIEQVDPLEAAGGEPDDFVYHVTPEPNVARILAQGFDPSRGGKTVRNYSAHSRGKVFFTERDGVSRWADVIEQHLFSEFDDPPDVAVLRVPKADIEGVLQRDPLGTRDAGGAVAYFTTQRILARP